MTSEELNERREELQLEHTDRTKKQPNGKQITIDQSFCEGERKEEPDRRFAYKGTNQ